MKVCPHCNGANDIARLIADAAVTIENAYKVVPEADEAADKMLRDLSDRFGPKPGPKKILSKRRQ